MLDIIPVQYQGYVPVIDVFGNLDARKTEAERQRRGEVHRARATEQRKESETRAQSRARKEV